MDSKQARAFEAFVAQAGDGLLRMATLLTSDPGLGEDVYQETLHRLSMRWSKVDSLGTVKSTASRAVAQLRVQPGLIGLFAAESTTATTRKV